MSELEAYNFQRFAGIKKPFDDLMHIAVISVWLNEILNP
jgi:hypothetical protein